MKTFKVKMKFLKQSFWKHRNHLKLKYCNNSVAGIIYLLIGNAVGETHGHNVLHTAEVTVTTLQQDSIDHSNLRDDLHDGS